MIPPHEQPFGQNPVPASTSSTHVMASFISTHPRTRPC